MLKTEIGARVLSVDTSPPLPPRRTVPYVDPRRAQIYSSQQRSTRSSGRCLGGFEDEPPTINLDMAANTFAQGMLYAVQHFGCRITFINLNSTLHSTINYICTGALSGEDVDDLVAQQMGVSSAAQLTKTQEKYKDKIKAKLEERAEELRKEKEARAIKFTAGKAAYARGQYPVSVEFFESALNEEGPFSQLGGEIQMWLALGYQACGREEECIETYRTIEKTHPVPSIRRQAAELRYIMEAPKLELSEDEKVKIPVLTDLEVNRGGRAPAPRARPVQKPKREKTWDEEFWENYEPPKYLKNKYVWAATAVVVAGFWLYYFRE